MNRYTFLTAILCITPGLVMAGDPDSFELSPDITIDVGSSIATDEDVLSEGLPVFLGDLPGSADLTAYHRLENGDALFSLDITVLLPGNQLSRPGDVIRHDGTNYTLEFDGLTNGIPSGARIDALSVDQDERLILSFDITLMLDGQVIADEDLARFNGGAFQQIFDASSVGIDTALDLDAAHFDPESQRLVMSFDSNGQIAGTTFSDEDLLVFNPADNSWTLAFDGSSSDPAWIAADLDATYAVLAMVNGDVIFYGGFETLIHRDTD